MNTVTLTGQSLYVFLYADSKLVKEGRFCFTQRKVNRQSRMAERLGSGAINKKVVGSIPIRAK